jgi:hypothetical protein
MVLKAFAATWQVFGSGYGSDTSAQNLHADSCFPSLSRQFYPQS